MKIMVTGGAGFIGSHVVDRMVEKGHEVVVIDNLYSGKKKNLNPDAEFYRMDIRDSGVGELFEEKSFDAVMHLAAQVDVRKSVEDPFFDADINIIGGLNLLESCVRYNVGNFIFASSGGVMYGECGREKPTEKRFPSPLCPYGNSKLSFEFYLNYYGHQYGMRNISLRLGNVYGPRQDPRGEAGVIAIFSGAIVKGRGVKIFGDGEQLRDYVYVEDVAGAFERALERGEGVYNIATEKSRSVNELFDEIKKQAGKPECGADYMPERKGELKVSRLSCRKAEKELQWKPEKEFKEGMEKTVEYFKKRAGNKIRN